MAKKVKNMLKNNMVLCVLVLAVIGLISIAFAADVKVKKGVITGVNNGQIYQAYVEYKDSDTISVTAGYGECNGSYWKITSKTDHDMTSLAAGEDFHYIY
ncbi:hypothetical protein LCGC14_2977750, partial [marine sediment metagenome]